MEIEIVASCSFLKLQFSSIPTQLKPWHGFDISSINKFKRTYLSALYTNVLILFIVTCA